MTSTNRPPEEGEEHAMSEGEPVIVLAAVLEGLEVVRRYSELNMSDCRMVQDKAMRLGLLATVVWIEQNKEAYARGIFDGFEAEDDAAE
jgi:hypothetical protein